jgi:hypothetical protein
MVIETLFLLLIVLSILMSGCLNSEEDQEQEGDNSEVLAGLQEEH